AFGSPLQFSDPLGLSPQNKGLAANTQPLGSSALQLIAEPQHSGDSKIQIEIGFHMWLRVNVYDKAGNVTGQRSLQFAPWTSSNGEGSFSTNAPKDDDSLFFFAHNWLEA